MAERTAIEWTQSTWNPIRARNRYTGKVGWHCEHASEACRFCYAERRNRWIGTGLHFKPGHRDDIEIFLDEKMLTLPLRWREGRPVFVCSMTDLFADFVTDEMILRVLDIIRRTSWDGGSGCGTIGRGNGEHTYQVLTKRPARMAAFMKRLRFRNDLPADKVALYLAEDKYPPIVMRNLWLGVSAEDQANADARIPDLLATPAAVRFVSLEPLLGPIDLTNLDHTGMCRRDEVHGISAIWKDNAIGRVWLDWVIVGGESGPKARPMHPDWERQIRLACAAAGVPYFGKQWGEWTVVYNRDVDDPDWRQCGAVERKTPRGRWLNLAGGFGFHGDRVVRVDRIGKKHAGRLFDGVEHNGMPR